jgi:hypothetical protein
MEWLIQKLKHCEQRIAFEELMEAVRQKSDRVEHLEQAIRVPQWSLAKWSRLCRRHARLI